MPLKYNTFLVKESNQDMILLSKSKLKMFLPARKQNKTGNLQERIKFIVRRKAEITATYIK